MNSSNQTPNQVLANSILSELESISEEFSRFQNSNALVCPPGCGKCCFKPDIYCTPIELLPLAMELYARGEAEEMLASLSGKESSRCFFMNITDEAAGKGRCTEYKFRPLVCRTFGVAPRHDKNKNVNFSVCTTLKEINASDYQAMLSKDFSQVDIPFIDQSKNKLSTLDPRFMEEEFPINKSLSIILEKVLFYESFNSFQSYT